MSQAKKQQGCFSRLLDKFDIFSYIPVPQSFPVSTRNSKIGSLIIILLFLAYLVYDLVEFFTNNVPSVNAYPTLLSTAPFTMPNIAVAFIYGSALNQSLTDQSYFNWTLQVANAPLGQKSSYTNVSMIQNCQPAWMGSMANNYQNLSCLPSGQLQLQGVYLGTANSMYVRLQVNLCNNVSGSCSSYEDLISMTSGGRLFVFVEKPQFLNLESGKLQTPPIQYDLYNFFIVPYMYNRVNIFLQSNNYQVYPDFLTSFTRRDYNLLQTLSTDFQISNVSFYNPMNALSISFLLSPRSFMYEVHYQTILTHISMWGALWGVLFSIFAIVFLGYNRNKFRKERPDWENFDKKVDGIEKKIVVSKGATGNAVQKQTELVDISMLRKNLVTESD